MTDTFSSATAQLAALDAGEISSVELVQLHLDRIAATNPALNSIVVDTSERALESARRADAARAAGERAPLLGVPMTLKESTQVAGLPQTAGFASLADHRPDLDGPIASAVFAAGACLLGKTNIPEALSDWQSDNAVYGRSDNPWNPARTPGGSTGGGAAALAAGMTPLEIGSDIGGSIRIPAAYCGVFGHRPTETTVPRYGAFPHADAHNPASVLGVQGPLARSVDDLELLFDVVAGPAGHEREGWRLELPASRHRELADFRVAVMPELPWAAPAAELTSRVDELAGFLSDRGAKVATAMPDVDYDAYFDDYRRLLTVMTTPPGKSLEDRARHAEKIRGTSDLDPIADGMVLDAVGMIALLKRREAATEMWQRFFDDWDVIVSPTALGAAFEHVGGPQTSRTLTIDDTDVPYPLNIIYPMWAVYAGLPATAFPAGTDRDVMPLGLQAMGPYLGDRTTLQFARLLERDWRGFERPPAAQ